jgi:hypothetical protein
MKIHKNFTCGHDIVNLMRDKKYDAYFCKECDVWIEKQCGDDACEYCPDRPDKPSMVKE